jgi:hypothetical protein
MCCDCKLMPYFNLQACYELIAVLDGCLIYTFILYCQTQQDGKHQINFTLLGFRMIIWTFFGGWVVCVEKETSCA